jgi:tryptophan synthase alpha chain
MFESKKEQGEIALMTYLPIRVFGNLNTFDLAEIFINSGIDFLEIGFPCWNPWLDGRTMQLNHKFAIEKGVSIQMAFEITNKLRVIYPNFPLVPMANYDVIYSFGIDKFIESLKFADVDAVEVPDYPFIYLDDKHMLYKRLKEQGIYFITFFDGLANKKDDIDIMKLTKTIILGSQGFIFLLASPGVTGARKEIDIKNINFVVSFLRETMKSMGVDIPIMAGFGISNSDHVKKLVEETDVDAVVVGSAISNLFQQEKSISEFSKFIKDLKSACKK